MDPDTLPGDGHEARHRESKGAPDMRSPGGAFVFDRADPALLVSLLPALMHVRCATQDHRIPARK